LVDNKYQGCFPEKERERGKPRNRFLTIENKLMVTRGEVGGRMGEIVMGIKECTCHDEHLVMYRIVESLYRTPETNITLYVNYSRIKIKTKQNKNKKEVNHNGILTIFLLPEYIILFSYAFLKGWDMKCNSPITIPKLLSI